MSEYCGTPDTAAASSRIVALSVTCSPVIVLGRYRRKDGQQQAIAMVTNDYHLSAATTSMVASMIGSVAAHVRPSECPCATE